MHDSIIENLKSSFYNHPDISSMLPGLEAALYDGRITSYSAAGELLHKYFKKKEH
jgi:hypothetical protein